MEEPVDRGLAAACHVVAMPFPGRGHVNPMMNLCKALASLRPDILVTFAVTEEWLGLIGADPRPDGVRLASIPNVVPSERLKAADFPGFYEAVMTRMEAPFEQLLDRLDPPPALFLADVELLWGAGVGNRRNIPVASLWTMSAAVFSIFLHFDLIQHNRHYPTDSSEHGSELVEYIPGVSSTTVSELPTRADPRVLRRAVECVSQVSKSQYLLFTSVYELEPREVEALKAEFPFPIYTIGPSIPYLDIPGSNTPSSSDGTSPDYFAWLDSQPRSSVLYISLGSFLSVSDEQMDEIVGGIRDSGVRYLWVARGEATRLRESCGELGCVVPWCQQLKVLCHSSVAGFWTHCGWNSTLESAFAGVPMLTFPIFLDQAPNSRQIVEDWGAGRRVKPRVDNGGLVTRDEIAETVRCFMNLEDKEGKEMRTRAAKLRGVCREAIEENGSSRNNLEALITSISSAPAPGSSK